MDEQRYETRQGQAEQDYEALCVNCGRCCGALEADPCAQLCRRQDGRYYCRVYPDRLGPQKTVSGKSFECVPIRALRKYGRMYPGCAYF